MNQTFGDVTVSTGDDHVAVVEIQRPPNNFFDVELIRSLAAAYEAVDGRPECRAILLCSEGRHFCAGVDFTTPPSSVVATATLYEEAGRLFRTGTPVVAAIQGAAIGGGLGLACSADFRIACLEARFSANFAYWWLAGGDTYGDEEAARTLTEIWARAVGLRRRPRLRRS